jgi:hypothetical protein
LHTIFHHRAEPEQVGRNRSPSVSYETEDLWVAIGPDFNRSKGFIKMTMSDNCFMILLLQTLANQGEQVTLILTW